MRAFASLLLAFATVTACGGRIASSTASTDGGAGVTTSSMDPSYAICTSTADCPAGEWCDHVDGVCGGKGTCMRLLTASPTPCSSAPAFCGCDRTAYCSRDDAHLAGVNIAVPGSCTQTCGPLTCDAVAEYCDHSTGGPDGQIDLYQCKTYASAGCADGPVEARFCACVQANAAARGQACSDADGHVQVEHFLP